jgi:hypothetical protein
MMNDQTRSEKQSELNAIQKEIEGERHRRILPDPLVYQRRNKRRLVLERELAADSGEQYADELKIDVVIGAEWHLVSNFGRDTVLLCGDVGSVRSAAFRFKHTEEFRLSGVMDDVDVHPLIGSGLDNYGLFIVRNSIWRGELLTIASAASSYNPTSWSAFEHYILCGKGGELWCLARGYECRSLAESILVLRDRARFWRTLFESSTP